MNELTVIIPIHKFDDTIAAMLDKAVASVKEASTAAKLMFALGTDVTVDAAKYGAETVSVDSTNFCKLINAAVEKCTTKYFSILEFDDTYTPNWFNNVASYIAVNEDISIYLPLTEITLADELEKGPVGYVNEAVWASSFSDQLGYLDIDCLQEYMNFNTTGGVFKTEDFIAVGGLKASMKLTFWYEFLMRAIYQNKKVFVVPKVGYQHLLGRTDSVSDIYNKTMKPEEAEWWIELAKKEYYFKTDRKKTYEE